MKHKDSATKDASPSRHPPVRRAFALTMLLAYLSSLSPAFCLDSKKSCPPTARTSSCTENSGSAERFSSFFFYYIYISVRVSGRQYQSISYSFDRVGNVLGYKNDCTSGGDYATSQSYAYDDLYQLVRAEGKTAYNPYKGTTMPVYESTYTQEFKFDILGNMTDKVSRETVRPVKVIGDELNYTKEFSYAEGFAHRLDHVGNIYYQYDLDGNITMMHRNPIPDGSGNGNSSGSGSTGGGDGDFWDDDWENGGTGGTIIGYGSGGSQGGGQNPPAQGDDGWDDDWDDDWDESGTGGSFEWGGSGNESGGTPGTGAVAEYSWDECGRLIGSTTGGVSASYIYGGDGQRTNKYTQSEETLYFNSMWTWHNGNANNDQTAKHIYLGTERIVTQMNSWKGQQTYSEEHHKTYYYHTDHLGSAQLITDWQGGEYQRIEYTPYGEEWVDKFQSENYVYMPYKFTAKERDEETGLYYYGARYLDPMYSIWISPDPALGDYLPTAGADNSSLPGMGGIFNTTNCGLYHYAGNNPVCYSDPDGKIAFCAVTALIGAGIGAGLAAYKSYKKTGKIDGWQVLEGAVAGGTIGLGFGLVGAELATSTALQAGNCLASFSEVTGIGAATATATTATAAGAGTVAATGQSVLGKSYDVVYGASNNGSLVQLANKLGSKLLSDFGGPYEYGGSWIDFSKSVLNEIAAQGGKILFDLTNVSDLQNVLAGTGKYANTVTSQELRYIMANWNTFKDVVTFCINEKAVSAPW